MEPQNPFSLPVLFHSAGLPVVKVREPRESRPPMGPRRDDSRGPFRAPQRRDTRRRF